MSVPLWLKWTLVVLVLVVVLYVVGFVLFGVGDDSSGPGTAAPHWRGTVAAVPL